MYVCIYLAYINIYINYKYSYVCVRGSRGSGRLLSWSVSLELVEKKTKNSPKHREQTGGGLGAKGGMKWVKVIYHMVTDRNQLFW